MVGGGESLQVDFEFSKDSHQSLQLLFLNKDVSSYLVLLAGPCSAFIDSCPPNRQTQLNNLFYKLFSS